MSDDQKVETEIKTEVEDVEVESISLKPPEIEGCTCKDEFAVAVCPVHHRKVSTVEEEILTITDEYLVSNEMGTWRGYIFMC